MCQSELPVYFRIKEGIGIDTICGVYLKLWLYTKQTLQIDGVNLEKLLLFRTLPVPEYQADLFIVIIEILLKKRNNFIPEDFAYV